MICWVVDTSSRLIGQDNPWQVGAIWKVEETTRRCLFTEADILKTRILVWVPLPTSRGPTSHSKMSGLEIFPHPTCEMKGSGDWECLHPTSHMASEKLEVGLKREFPFLKYLPQDCVPLLPPTYCCFSPGSPSTSLVSYQLPDNATKVGGWFLALELCPLYLCRYVRAKYEDIHSGPFLYNLKDLFLKK